MSSAHTETERLETAKRSIEERTNDRTFVARATERAHDLVRFIDASPTPFHAVDRSLAELERAGFSRLDERDTWRLEPGARHAVVRDDSSLVAFIVGRASPHEAGFQMIAAHTDSPGLELKPSAVYERQGYRQLGAEVYGGPLLSTWLDRDLSIAGRVIVATDRGHERRRVDLVRPIARIPNLCIHLNRKVNESGLELNAQTHMIPVFGIGTSTGRDTARDIDFLRVMLAETLDVAPSTILHHELSLYDTQRGQIAGPNDEFIHASRLDNLASCHLALFALVAASAREHDATRLIALYDHEEVGSRSAQGAAGPFLESVLRRIVDAMGARESQAFDRAMSQTALLSADMAHAIHPNYADKHDAQHAPLIGRGPVLKTNANLSYATDADTAARFVSICRELGFEPQRYVNRNDLPCGSTIGPISAARLGIKVIDVGNPMLSMHSIREMAGTVDHALMHEVLTRFFDM